MSVYSNLGKTFKKDIGTGYKGNMFNLWKESTWHTHTHTHTHNIWCCRVAFWN